MKALTVCQPYADMIAKGEKIIENRTWLTAYRGPLAIHAGKSKTWLDTDDMEERPHMVFGAVIATVTLNTCLHVSRLPPELADRLDAGGPFCWILGDVVVLEKPVWCRGAQGLWEWTPPGD
jgi:hypothetical protein